MQDTTKQAPGTPGISPKWTTSAKDGIGTAINIASEVSFTLSHGILNEIYYPRADKAATRDMGLIVTNGVDFFSEEKRDTESVTRQVSPGIPAYAITNSCLEGRYEIFKHVVTDPFRNTLMQRIEFKVKQKDEYHIYAILAPRLNNMGLNNTAWVSEYKGHPMIFAENDGITLAMACSKPWRKCSVGFVGTSDGWQDLYHHKQMTWEYQKAENGNVALIGEIYLEKEENNTFDIAIGFGLSEAEAANHAISSLFEGFEAVQERYIGEWKSWQDNLRPLHEKATTLSTMFRISAAVLRTHQSKLFPGAMVASLSIPWGDARGDDDNSGYHMVWPRDLVECAGGLLALNAKDDVLRVLNYLMVTQEPDGHWSQNMWLEGTPYWEGIQLDETALPILLIDLCIKNDLLEQKQMSKYWKTVRQAVKYLLTKGLMTEQERWEEQSGISAFTISAMVAAMLAAADLAEQMEEKWIAMYCRQTADTWNDSVEFWLYAKHTRLAQELGVEGYYLRVNPAKIPAEDLGEITMEVKNNSPDQRVVPVSEMISIDPLALVRFGLRAADDPRILNTVKVIDAKLKTVTPNGPSWYRYVHDGYGEQEDGGAYNGAGIGRPWPLLTAERAHYEIALGNIKGAEELLKAVERFSSNGLIPEQIWDQADIAQHGLVHGKRSGSAMPLVWAHAEHIKLVCSVKEERVFDMPEQTQDRYIRNKVSSNLVTWRLDLPITSVPTGKNLRVETVRPANVKWSMDNWANLEEIATRDMGLDIHYIDLKVNQLTKKKEIVFTLFWLDIQEWSGENYKVVMV